MKAYLFPVFITLLGLLTAYLFCTFWHSEAVNPPQITKTPQTKVTKDLANKPIIPRNTVPVSKASQTKEEKEMLEEMQKHANIPNLTPEQAQAQTQAVYEALTPEDHEEALAEAEAAFKTLDTHVLEVEAQLAQQMQAVEEAQNELVENQ